MFRLLQKRRSLLDELGWPTSRKLTEFVFLNAAIRNLSSIQPVALLVPLEIFVRDLGILKDLGVTHQLLVVEEHEDTHLIPFRALLPKR